MLGGSKSYEEKVKWDKGQENIKIGQWYCYW